MTRILVVDDEVHIRRALRSRLTAEGYDVVEAADGPRAVDEVALAAPDAVILDLGLPGFDGAEVVRRVRVFSGVPIVMLSALDQESAKISALDAGADDYVTKPFSSDELLARMRAVLRRASTPEDQSTAKLRLGRAVVDLSLRLVEVDGATVRVTPTEWALLELFARNPGKLLTSRFLIERVWGGAHGSEASSLRIYVSHLRRIIEDVPADPRFLLTEPGAGYRLVSAEPVE
jgi:two-component system KDP operon response regulator KdpE